MGAGTLRPSTGAADLSTDLLLCISGYPPWRCACPAERGAIWCAATGWPPPAAAPPSSERRSGT